MEWPCAIEQFYSTANWTSVHLTAQEIAPEEISPSWPASFTSVANFASKGNSLNKFWSWYWAWKSEKVPHFDWDWNAGSSKKEAKCNSKTSLLLRGKKCDHILKLKTSIKNHILNLCFCSFIILEFALQCWFYFSLCKMLMCGSSVNWSTLGN